MPTVKTDMLDKMMERIRNLLARADHPTANEHEADMCRSQAEKLMHKYRVTEEALIASGDAVVNGINVLFRETPVYRRGGEFDMVYQTLVSYAINHAGCKAVWTGRSADGERLITIVGYEADIRYAEVLFANARLVFADRMEPKPEASLSDMDNVYRMRSAGMERIRIAEVMGWGTTGSATAKVTRLYKAACKARGEEAVLTGRGNSVVDFRAAYADAFTTEFWNRLYLARNAVENEVEEGGMVLHGREERIQEAMYERWPELRPSTEPAVRSMKPVKYRGPTKDDLRREARRNNPLGRAAGRKAAAEVQIKHGTPKRRLGDN